MDHVFINYRRADSEPWTLLLHKEFVAAFGAEKVVLDVHDLHPGEEYAERVLQQIRQSRVLVVVIGPQWLTIGDQRGPEPRLARRDDLLRLEIAEALRAGLTVIPVLVGGAVMPEADQLPPDIARLAGKNAIRLTSEYLSSDLRKLIAAVERAGLPRSGSAKRQKTRRWSRIALWVAAAGLLGLVVVVGGIVAGSIGDGATTTTTAAPVAVATTATTTIPETSADLGTTPTTVPPPVVTTAGPACRGGVEPSLPVEAQNVDVIEADFDGDGSRDQLFVYNVPASEDFYRFRMVLGYGYAYEYASEIRFTFPPQFIADIDVDIDGDQEAFANYIGGASTVRVALLDFRDCVLTESAELYVGGSIGAGAGFECLFGEGGNDLARYSYEHQGDGTYLIDVTRYKLDAGGLTRNGVTERVRATSEDPAFHKSATITCGDLDISF